MIMRLAVKNAPPPSAIRARPSKKLLKLRLLAHTRAPATHTTAPAWIKRCPPTRSTHQRCREIARIARLA